MQPEQLWASVAFTAVNGRPERLLQEGAQAGLRLSAIEPIPGGFAARCPARQYRALARLARRCRVTLRLTGKQGLYFELRPLLRRTGLWLGLAVCLPALLWAQGLVWAVDCRGLTPGQQARVQAILRESCGLVPGQRAGEELLTAGAYALQDSGEFSWASLNFLRGRLTVEVRAAKPVPEVAAGSPQGLFARTDGVVLAVNLRSGTALVRPGQSVRAGEPLIGTLRTERDGSPLHEDAAGTVTAQLLWRYETELPLRQEGGCLLAPAVTGRVLTAAGRRWAVPVIGPELLSTLNAGSAVQEPPLTEAWVRHGQLTLFGLPLPLSWEETLTCPRGAGTVYRTETEALAAARLAGLRALYADYPDAEIIARQETSWVENGVLKYKAAYAAAADLCTDTQAAGDKTDGVSPTS